MNTFIVVQGELGKGYTIFHVGRNETAADAAVDELMRHGVWHFESEKCGPLGNEEGLVQHWLWTNGSGYVEMQEWVI